MSAMLLLLLLAPSGRAELAAADKIAAAARAETDIARRARGVEAALAAYDGVLRAHAKDRRLVPLVRRRRASLLLREKRVREALEEHDHIVTGRARRKDKARALVDGAALLVRMKRFEEAEKRYRRAIAEYPDLVATRAKALVARGRVLERLGRDDDAERDYRAVVRRCRSEAKYAIAAYDRLALLEIRRKRPRHARRWLYRCVGEFEPRAARGDRYGAYLSRLLGDMRAPRELTKALAAPGPHQPAPPERR